MFKNSFFKYLFTFSVIILVSFIILSSIVTSMFRSRVAADKVSKLEIATITMTEYFDDKTLYGAINTEVVSFAMTLLPVINYDYEFNIIITDASGEVLMSTNLSSNEDEGAEHSTGGKIDLQDFEEYQNSEGETFIKYEGGYENICDQNALFCGKAFSSVDDEKGYVFSFISNDSEARAIMMIREIVFNSSIWVLLAALVATWFITDHITHPLKSMTRAAKKFAKGNFDERVVVRGKDEVAQLAIAFNQMADSLQSLEKMRNSFLANVSHDLRTPMTTISGFIEGITSGAIPEEQHAHYLGIISSEVHRLSRLVSQLLDISRLESGDRKFELIDFDIAEVARLIIISFEKQLEEKQLDVEFMTDSDEIIVNADKDAIYQVLYNLCHNAIKFSRERGRFYIKIHQISSKSVKVEIYDDGQVVSKEDAINIFDRFYKTDSSRGLDKNGVGLGLYICKTIIDAHGEEIHCEPHAEGCEFWFTLKSGKENPRLKSRED